MSRRSRRSAWAPPLLAVAACAVAGAPALAAPVAGPSGDAFYTPPAGALTGPHGDAVWYRSADLNIGSSTKPKGSTFLYRTQTAQGATAVATATVIVPSTAWTGGGERPVVAFAPGTQGMAPTCAPSRQPFGSMGYENSSMAAAVNKGYTVVVTDYQGATNGSTGQPYVVGISEGHDVLDSVLAARQVPGSGISANAKIGVWGYSQGGGSAVWAGQLKNSYAPSVNLVGVAAGGVPGDLLATGKNLNGSLGAAFLGYAVIGLDKAYPQEINLQSVTNDKGKALVAQLVKECTFESVPKYAFQNIDQYIAGGRTFDQIAATPGFTAVLNRLKAGQTAIPAPLYQYHAVADELIPAAQAQTLRRAYCNKGMKVQWDGGVPLEHLTASFAGAANAVAWLDGRFKGTAAPNNCWQPW